MQRALTLAILAGCAAPRAELVNSKPPPAACIPRALAAEVEQATSPGFALADGDRAIACLQGSTRLCLALDPATGEVLAKVPDRSEPELHDPGPVYEPTFATPDNSDEQAVLDPSGRFAFVLGRDPSTDYLGDTYEVATGKLVTRVAIPSLSPRDQPPPVMESMRMSWHAGSIVIGRPGTLALIVDPKHGEVAFLVDAWAYVGDHLVVGYDFVAGDLVVYDLSPDAHVATRAHLGVYKNMSLATAGGHAIAVVYAPLATLSVDAAGKISPLHPLPICNN